MCPIPISIFSINHDTHLPTLWSCAQLPMCPIPQGTPSLSLISHMIPLCPCVPLPMCSVAHIKKDVTLSERCQAVKKMSSCQKDVKCQKVKHTDYGRGSQKKINWHNEVHTYWHQFWCQIWRSPKLFKNTFYAHFEGFWSPSYVMSKLTSICVNLIMSIYFFCEPPPQSMCLTFWHLTSFWQLDIFLTAWHLSDNLTSFLICATEHMGNGTHGQRGIMCNIKDRDGVAWVMGHMGNGAHGQLGTWS